MFTKTEITSDDMSGASFDELLRLSNRLYCCWQAALHGDDLMIGHREKIAGEIYQIWSGLEDVMDKEKERHQTVSEEMKKFTQGFAYEPTKRSSST